ncbi:hypothetical protein G7072_04820 [Nocardioides sp. HDW12B]|uniref:hypothetical protein n=1 Tax=Nocardioides sp. HDW12B TaxID=2714939 RepID=UPI00140E53E5|nr:hypothetical protein [Nocardioides sp. HDW12B]QIK65752.1 hypothetical protein G7072_04820 [Nocardioides sp. HDW12B]
MRTDMPTALRRLAVLTTGLALGTAASPASAEPPTAWEQAEDPSTLEFLTVLVGIPLAIIAVLALLTYLPSMIRGQSTEPALVFRERSEWFGGPRKTPAADEVPADRQPVGGAGAQF